LPSWAASAQPDRLQAGIVSAQNPTFRGNPDSAATVCQFQGSQGVRVPGAGESEWGSDDEVPVIVESVFGGATFLWQLYRRMVGDWYVPGILVELKGLEPSTS
jgi:hypothetical protein